MAAKKQPPKPLFPLKHEFYASLDRYIEATTVLAGTVRMFMGHGFFQDDKIEGALQSALDQYDAARFDDTMET